MVSDLHLRLEFCYEQFRCLEKERKKTEADLARHFPGKKISSANQIHIPRLPPNPSKIGRLIIDHLREHSKVGTLTSKMAELNQSIKSINQSSSMMSECLAGWQQSIHNVQIKRREEIVNATTTTTTTTTINVNENKDETQPDGNLIN